MVPPVETVVVPPVVEVPPVPVEIVPPVVGVELPPVPLEGSALSALQPDDTRASEANKPIP